MTIRQISEMERLIWRSSKLKIKTIIRYSPINVYLQKTSHEYCTDFIANIITISLLISIISSKGLSVQSRNKYRKRCEICSRLTIKTPEQRLDVLAFKRSFKILQTDLKKQDLNRSGALRLAVNGLGMVCTFHF